MLNGTYTMGDGPLGHAAIFDASDHMIATFSIWHETPLECVMHRIARDGGTLHDVFGLCLVGDVAELSA